MVLSSFGLLDQKDSSQSSTVIQTDVLTISEHAEQNDSLLKYLVYSELPEFPGGEKALRRYLRDNIQYPTRARNLGIQGTVWVSFNVSRLGAIDSVVAKTSPDSSLAKEAIRVVSAMPNWKPAKNMNQTIAMNFMIPVFFSLSGKKVVVGNSVNEIRSAFEEKVAKQTLSNVSVYEIYQYLLSSTDLKWTSSNTLPTRHPINTSYKYPLASLEQLHVYLLLDAKKMVLPGNHFLYSSQVVLNNIPIRHKATLIALKQEKGEYHLAVERTVVQDGVLPELHFEPLSMELLKKQLEKFNW